MAHRPPPESHSRTRPLVSLCKFITTFLSETLLPSASKSQLCKPSIVLISFQIPSQNSSYLIQRQFVWFESRGGAAFQTPILNVHEHGYAHLLLSPFQPNRPIAKSPSCCRSWSHDFLSVSIPIPEISHCLLESHPRNAQCICDVATCVGRTVVS